MTCIGYRRQWKQASDLAKAGDAYNAVVALQTTLREIAEGKRTEAEKRLAHIARQRIGTAGVGAIIGSIILPGIGTAIGGALGGIAASKFTEGSDTGGSAFDPFEAETHYRLGVIYEMLRNPATLHHYMQAKLLQPTHTGAIEALVRLQPQIPMSQQLQELDDTF